MTGAEWALGSQKALKKIREALERISRVEELMRREFRRLVVSGVLEAELGSLANLVASACTELDPVLCSQVVMPCANTLKLLETYARAIRVRIRVHGIERGVFREHEDFLKHILSVKGRLAYILAITTNLKP